MTCNCSVLLFAMPSKVAFFLLFKGIHRQWVVKEVIDTSRAIHFISLTHKKRKKKQTKKTSVTKHGATEIQGQVINLVEIELAFS